MPAKSTMTPADIIALLQDCAKRNGGWLSTRDYTALKHAGTPFYSVACKILGVATWGEACVIAGIDQTPFDSMPAELDETQIKFVLAQSTRGGAITPLHYRQQASIYCLRIVAQQLNMPRFTAKEYDAIADKSLYSARTIMLTFDGWLVALAAADLLNNSGQRKTKEAQQADMMADIANAAHPPDWQLQPVDIPVCRVTEVTETFVMANGLGLRHSETRMVLR